MLYFENFGVNDNKKGNWNLYYNQTGETVQYLEAEIKSIQGDIWNAKEELKKWEELLRRITEARGCDTKSCMQNTIGYWTDELALTNYVQPVGTKNQIRKNIEAFYNQSSESIIGFKSIIGTRNDLLKQKQNELEALKKEIAETEEAEAETGEAQARRRGVETETSGKKLALYGGIALVGAGVIYLVFKTIRR